MRQYHPTHGQTVLPVERDTVRSLACRSGNRCSRGGDRKPTLRTRLSLESLDGRVVPSGTPTDPPPAQPPAQTPATQHSFTVNNGDVLWTRAENGESLALSRDEDGNVWAYYADSGTVDSTPSLLMAGQDINDWASSATANAQAPPNSPALQTITRWPGLD